MDAIVLFGLKKKRFGEHDEVYPGHFVEVDVDEASSFLPNLRDTKYACIANVKDEEAEYQIEQTQIPETTP